MLAPALFLKDPKVIIGAHDPARSHLLPDTPAEKETTGEHSTHGTFQIPHLPTRASLLSRPHLQLPVLHP